MPMPMPSEGVVRLAFLFFFCRLGTSNHMGAWGHGVGHALQEEVKLWPQTHYSGRYLGVHVCTVQVQAQVQVHTCTVHI
jgi:hypothetical protein